MMQCPDFDDLLREAEGEPTGVTVQHQDQPVQGGTAHESDGLLPYHPITGAPLLSKRALKPEHQQIFPYDSFNPIQSVCFESIYHENCNLVVSAPTGAGKTVLFELAILKMFGESGPKRKAIYVSPLRYQNYFSSFLREANMPQPHPYCNQISLQRKIR